MKTATPRTVLALLAPLGLAGCGGVSEHSPTIDVLGSYFPAWMLCMLIGVALTVIARCIFIALGLTAALRPAPVIYTGLLVVFTLSTWLVFFRN